MKSLQTWSVARSPRTARQGSPGTRRASANTMKTIPSRTGIVTSTRRAMNCVIGLGHPCRDRAAIDSGGAADATPPIGSLRVTDGTLAGRRVEEAPPEAGPVVERTGATLVQRMLGVPLERVAEH